MISLLFLHFTHQFSFDIDNDEYHNVQFLTDNTSKENLIIFCQKANKINDISIKNKNRIMMVISTFSPIIIVVDSQKFSTQIQIASFPQVQARAMPTLLNTFSNAKKSIKLLQAFPLDPETKNNIKKLKEMLREVEYTQTWMKDQERRDDMQEDQLDKEIALKGHDQEENNCIINDDCQKMKEGNKQTKSKQVSQDFLVRIVEDIHQLLLMNDEDKSHLKENDANNQPLNSHLSIELCSLLLKISDQIKCFIKKLRKNNSNNESNSSCSYNTNPNINNGSNSGSVRSLLTEKLKQFANEDFDDPEYKNERLVIQGNLMIELNKYSRGSKPMVVSRRFQELSEPFSMQNKQTNERQLQNWMKNGGKAEKKGRVHSQRTILGQINLSQSHMKEKRAKKDETGCSRCEIY